MHLLLQFNGDLPGQFHDLSPALTWLVVVGGIYGACRLVFDFVQFFRRRPLYPPPQQMPPPHWRPPPR